MEANENVNYGVNLHCDSYCSCLYAFFYLKTGTK